MKQVLSYIGFFIEAAGIAAFIFVIGQAVLISQDNQDTLNDIADKLNTMNVQVQANTKKLAEKPKPIIVRKHYSQIHHIEIWLAGKRIFR